MLPPIGEIVCCRLEPALVLNTLNEVAMWLASTAICGTVMSMIYPVKVGGSMRADISVGALWVHKQIV